jgi:hypothetical protein
VIKSSFYKNLSCGLIIALFALSSLSAVVYHDDAIAGKDKGGHGEGRGGGDRGGHGEGRAGGDRGGHGKKDGAKAKSAKAKSAKSPKRGSGTNANPNPGASREAYESWLSDLIRD